MTSAIIGALVRQLLTMGGASALISGDQTTQIIGAVSTIVSVVWSIIQKKNVNEKISTLTKLNSSQQ